MTELVLFIVFGSVGWAAAVVAALHPRALAAAAALVVSTLMVASLCLLHGAVDSSAIIMLLFGGGAALTGLITSSSFGEPEVKAGTALRRPGCWIGLSVAAALLGVVVWILQAQGQKTDIVAVDSGGAGQIYSGGTAMLFISMLVAVAATAVVMLTRTKRHDVQTPGD